MSVDVDTSGSQDDETIKYDPVIELQRDRRRNDLKLRGTFERIFEKYSKDFSNIGDEIDLETGRVVVNNGHLYGMQNERDVGSNASSRFVKAFAEELEEEEEREESASVDPDSEEDELSTEHPLHVPTPVSRRTMRDTIPDSASDGLESDGNVADLDESEPDQQDDDEDDRSQGLSNCAQQPPASVTDGILSNLPAIQDGLTALAPRALQPGETYNIDPAAIQALGQSIANQIAQFLSSVANPVLQPHLANPWSAPPLPRDAFALPEYQDSSRRRMLTPGLRQSVPPGLQSPAGGLSLWAPSGAHNPRRKRKKQRLEGAKQSQRLHMSIEGRQDEAIDPRLQAHGSFVHDDNAGSGTAETVPYDPYETESASGNDSRETSTDPFGDNPAIADDSDVAQTVHQNYTANSKISRRFTKAEDDLIKRLRDVNAMSWSQIAAFLPGRSGTSVHERHKRLLKHRPAPRQPIIKREIIEILSDEESLRDASTPARRSDHATRPRPQSITPDRPRPYPLLRQALDQRNSRRDVPVVSSGYTGSYMNDTSFATQVTPVNAPVMFQPWMQPHAYMPPPRQQMYYPPQPYMNHNGQSMYRNAYMQPINGQMYPMPSQPHATSHAWAPPPAAPRNAEVQEVQGGGPTPQIAKRGRGYHGKPEKQPRYNGFDHMAGDSTFGILRTKELAPYASNPLQEEALGPRTSKSGAFGLLKLGQAEGVPRKKRQRKRQAANADSSVNAPAVQQPHPDGLPRDASLLPIGDSAAPAIDLRTPITGLMPTRSEHEVDDLAGDSDGALIVTPREGSLPSIPRPLRSSPALPTPPEDSFEDLPVRESPSRTDYTRGPSLSVPKFSPIAQRSVSRNVLGTPALGARNRRSSFASPTAMRGTPALHTEKRPLTEDSDDELA